MGLSNKLSYEARSFPHCHNPHMFFSVRGCETISLHWNPGLYGLSCSPVVPLGLSTHKSGITQSASCFLAQSTSYHPDVSRLCPISTLPTSLNECFFFNSLVVRLSCSLILWQFWLFFVHIGCYPSCGCVRK